MSSLLKAWRLADILGIQLDQQARTLFANGLAANLETFALILQDTEKNLFDGLKRTAADNTLQITLDLEMRSQLTNYIEAQRRVLGINFLGVYDGKSGAIAFSGGEQNAGLKEWRLSSAGETGISDCVAVRDAEQQLVTCNNTVYLVSVVPVLRADESNLGDASAQSREARLLGYLLGGTPLAAPALIASVQDTESPPGIYRFTPRRHVRSWALLRSAERTKTRQRSSPRY